MNQHFNNCSKLQAMITDICNPKGDWIHRTYTLELEEITVMGLRYASKFPIPIGTKLFIDVVFQREKVRIIIEVIENKRADNGKYSVGCIIAYQNSEQDLGRPHYLCNLHYGSGIH